MLPLLTNPSHQYKRIIVYLLKKVVQWGLAETKDFLSLGMSVREGTIFIASIRYRGRERQTNREEDRKGQRLRDRQAEK